MKNGGQNKKEQEKQILQKDKEWFNNFMDENYSDYQKQQSEQKVKKSKRNALWITLSSSAAVIAIVVSLVLLWPTMFGGSTSSGGHYAVQDEMARDSDLETVNSSLKGFYLTFSDEYEPACLEVYDEVSKDILYYKVSMEYMDSEMSKAISIFLYTNKDYERGNAVPDNADSILINGFNIKYTEEITDEDLGDDMIAYTIINHAVFEHNGIEIQIEFEQFSLEENSNLFSFIEQTFKVS